MCNGVGGGGNTGGAGTAGAADFSLRRPPKRQTTTPDDAQGDITGNPELTAFSAFLKKQGIRLQ